MRKIKRLAIVFVAAMIVVILVIPFTAYCAELRIGEEYWYNVGYIYGTILQVDGKPAFCVDPDAALPTSGSYTGSVETNPALLKILYYGYGGKGFNSTVKAKMDSYRNNQYITASGNDLYYALTRRCAAKAYGANYRMAYYEDWNQAIDSIFNYFQSQSTPVGFKVYIINKSNQSQPVVYLVEDEKIILQLQKQSSNTSISNNNACYSLAGAVYGIFTDAACTKEVGEITTNANGFAAYNKSVYIGTYYAKEITAPKGFALSREVLTFKRI